MAARYALSSFWWTTASGAQHFVIEGALRDSVTSAVAVALPSLFTATPPAAGTGHITGKLAQHLAQQAGGSEL